MWRWRAEPLRAAAAGGSGRAYGATGGLPASSGIGLVLKSGTDDLSAAGPLCPLKRTSLFAAATSAKGQ
jgi:hypothetical protein